MADNKKQVWMVDEHKGENGRPPSTFWTKIGTAVENDEGELDVSLSAIPLTGRIVIRPAALAAAVAKRSQR